MARRHVGYNCLLVYDADPSTVRSLLPENVEPLENPRGLFWFQQHHAFGTREELHDVDEETRKFTELTHKIPARFGEMLGNYVIQGTTDNRSLVARGWMGGVPQKLGRIFITELHPADAEYCRPKAGLRIGVKFRCPGDEGTGEMVLQDPIEQIDLPFTIWPNFGRRRLFDEASGRVVIDDLFAGGTTDYRVTNLWTGPGELHIGGDADSPFRQLPPIGPVTGYYFTSEWSGAPGTRFRSILHQYAEPESTTGITA